MTARGALEVFLKVECALIVTAHDLLSGVECIRLVPEFLPEDSECQAIHLQLTIVNVPEVLLLLGKHRLVLLL
jgi:hypothetical protein